MNLIKTHGLWCKFGYWVSTVLIWYSDVALSADVTCAD
jgi:hypothetical protein